mgnify:CR=1 FL=1
MIGAREVALMEEMRGHASRSAALAKIGSIPESIIGIGNDLTCWAAS